MIKELTESQYLETFGEEMLELTETVEDPVDIWAYVMEINRSDLLDAMVIEKRLVEAVYRNEQGTFDHIIIPTKLKNLLLIIIVNLVEREIHGYYKLDINSKYN